jgi:hypothetical protein
VLHEPVKETPVDAGAAERLAERGCSVGEHLDRGGLSRLLPVVVGGRSQEGSSIAGGAG